MKTRFTFLLLCIFLVIVSQAQYKYLKGTLSASQSGAGVTSSGGGVVIVRFNTVTKQLDHWGNFRGLVADINNQHIHTGAPGVNGPVTVNLTRTGGTRDGGLFGSQVLNATQEADLLAGNMYTNVHSTTYGSGEIRAQLTLATDGQTEHFNARLQAAQAIQPDTSKATGIVNALVDKATNMLYLTSTYTGLLSAANNAHIHSGAPNVSGGVIVPLIFVAGTSGTLDTARVISDTHEANILSGATYVNIHTPNYGSGEIRGQLLSVTDLRYLAGSLQGSQETNQTPPNTSVARGTVVVKYNSQTNFLEITGDYQNLSATISGSHIHGPFGPPGSDAPVLFNIANQGGMMGTLTGGFTLTEPEEVNLLAGNMYVNVHSSGTYAAGEIRAQLLPLSSGETQYLTTTLDVGQERAAFPANTITSSGVGAAVGVLDKLTGNIYLTGSYSNLSSGIANAHIHRGPAAVSGPVSIQLQYVSGASSGTITGSATNIRSTLMDSIINGNTYVNIHSTTYGSGEIRGQLGDLVLPVKLSYFNGYKNGGKVSLVWESAQEINLSSYQIEEQGEGGRWIVKTTVPANGGNRAMKYQASDVPLSIKTGYVFYRLKMVDKDGQYSYSPVVKINFGKGRAELTIQVNPVMNDKLRYSVTGFATDKKAMVSIVDYNGRVLLTTTTSTLSNNFLPINTLAKGMYKLVVRVDDTLMEQSFLK